MATIKKRVVSVVEGVLNLNNIRMIKHLSHYTNPNLTLSNTYLITPTQISHYQTPLSLHQPKSHIIKHLSNNTNLNLTLSNTSLITPTQISHYQTPL
jgi:hypothetical protein